MACTTAVCAKVTSSLSSEKGCWISWSMTYSMLATLRHVQWKSSHCSHGQRDVLHYMPSCSATKAERMRKRRALEQWCLSSQGITMSAEPYFLGSGCTPPYLWEATNEFLAWVCLCMQLLVGLENCLCLNSWVLALLPSRFSPWSHLGSMSKWLCGIEDVWGLPGLNL